MNFLNQEKSPQRVLVLGFLLYLSVLFINDGFMALDEYWVGITRYIPAQTSSLMTLVAPDDVKSPLQLLPMHVVAQAALAVGISSPYLQYRAVIFVLGLLSALVLGWSFVRYARNEKLDRPQTTFLYLMMTFYFAAPFGITRPMFESVAAPWLTLAAVFAVKYDRDSRLKDLLWGVALVSLAFVLRQQLGICALIFVLLPLLKKQWRHLYWVTGLGLLFFVLSGIPDYFIRGKFHYSLLNLTLYNYEHGSEYGNQSILFYPAMIFVIGFIPFYVKKYTREFLFNYVTKQRALLIILGLFVFLHSLFPNKWERFLISVLPILVMLAFPFLYELQKNFRQHWFRLSSLYLVNFFLFVPASFFPAQKNLIEMSLYLDKHPEIKKIHRLADTPGWITEAFILNKQFEFVAADNLQLNSVNWESCDQALVVGEAQEKTYRSLTNQLELNAVFDVNLIEQWAFKMNPEKNLRRVQLKLYSGCKR